jgi:hypothetical protein
VCAGCPTSTGISGIFGANIQAIMRPDGLPIWTSAAMPGYLHDTSCARELGVTAGIITGVSGLPRCGTDAGAISFGP